MHGASIWMRWKQNQAIITPRPVPLQLPLKNQKPSRILHWVNSYVHYCVPKMVYLQMQLIASGLTLAGTWETSRYKPWVEFHINYSLWLIICGTHGSHELRNYFPNLQPIPIPILLDNEVWHDICHNKRCLLLGHFDSESLLDCATLLHNNNNMLRAD